MLLEAEQLGCDLREDLSSVEATGREARTVVVDLLLKDMGYADRVVENKLDEFQYEFIPFTKRIILCLVPSEHVSTQLTKSIGKDYPERSFDAIGQSHFIRPCSECLPRFVHEYSLLMTPYPFVSRL